MPEVPLPFMTREVFDTLILAVMILGLALAVVRLYRDFTRRLHPDNTQSSLPKDD
jgi:cytochrome c oxidase assembly protein Cox11